MATKKTYWRHVWLIVTAGLILSVIVSASKWALRKLGV